MTYVQEIIGLYACMFYMYEMENIVSMQVSPYTVKFNTKKFIL